MKETGYRIFAEASPLGSGPPRPARVRTVERAVACRLTSARPTPRQVIEGEVTRILDEAPTPGESVQHAFDRKERDLRALFSSLTRAESETLYSTLVAEIELGTPRARLARLTPERRNRILSFLGDSGRRRMVGS
jgi:hypothetical protein